MNGMKEGRNDDDKEIVFKEWKEGNTERKQEMKEKMEGWEQEK